MSIAGDARYEVAYRSTWSASAGPDDQARPIGHVVIRLLDGHEVVAEVPVHSEEEARALIERAEGDIRGAAEVFETAWGLAPVDPGPLPPTPPTRTPDSLGEAEDRDPDEGEEVFSSDPRVQVLPDPATVFAAEQPWLARVLHPLAWVELSAIDPALTARVPVLSPVEPEDGLLGESTERYHDDHAGMNWVTFRLDGDGRIRFLGGRGFFEIEACELDGTRPPDGLHAWYADAERQFAGTRARWEAHSVVAYGRRDDPSRLRDGATTVSLPVLDQLGGEPGYGNWASFPPPASLRLDESSDISPVLRLVDGRPFAFVCATSGYPWRDHGADAILVFFEPETRTIAVTFDWS